MISAQSSNPIDVLVGYDAFEWNSWTSALLSRARSESLIDMLVLRSRQLPNVVGFTRSALCRIDACPPLFFISYAGPNHIAAIIVWPGCGCVAYLCGPAMKADVGDTQRQGLYALLIHK